MSDFSEPVEPVAPPEPVKPASAVTATSSSKGPAWIAGALILLCAVTAVGSWRQAPARPAAEDGTASQFSSAFLQTQPDLGIIDVEGTIMYSSSGGFTSQGASAERIVQAIRQAEKDGVKGLLLQINSPGGTASASQAIYQELMRVRKAGKMKIVAAMGDVAASGGFYIACAADKIYANPATITGSIGVISQSTNLQGLYQKVGLEAEVIKSGKHKDIGSPYRDMTAEERKILQNLIDDTYEDFLGAVAEGRGLAVDTVRPLADGRIYTGNQAQKHKLVDALGGYTVALQELKKMTQLASGAEVKNYSKPGFEDVWSMLGAQAAKWSPTAAFQQVTQQELHHLNKVPLMIYR